MIQQGAVRLLLVGALLTLDLQAEGYQRLSEKLIDAQKQMHKVYRMQSRSLALSDKKVLRMKQHIWKVEKEKSCSKYKEIKKESDRCHYDMTRKRIKFLQNYNPMFVEGNLLEEKEQG